MIFENIITIGDIINTLGILIAAMLTFLLIRETIKTRREAYRPYLSLDFADSLYNKGYRYKIKNIGNRTATKIIMTTVEDSNYISNTLNKDILNPNENFTYPHDFDKDSMLNICKVIIKYHDNLNNSYSQVFEPEFSAYLQEEEKGYI